MAGRTDHVLLTMLVTLLVLTACHAFPGGPPHSVCWSALPFHTSDGKQMEPQTTPSPYVITVNVTSLRNGDTLKVKVGSRPGPGTHFRGLFLQVKQIPRFEGDAFVNNPIGSYTRLTRNTRLTACHVSQDTMTHMDPYLKMFAEFEWKAPVFLTRDVVIRATILTNFTTFWTDVESPVIQLVDRGRQPAEALEKPWVRDIINTIKVQGDREAEEAATMARFGKGFRGAFDPDGYIMVQFVTEMLPFENKFAVTGNITSKLNSMNEFSSNVGTTLGIGNVPRYKKLVRDLLNGDYSVISELEMWLDANGN